MAENRQYDHEYKVQAVKLAKEIGQALGAGSQTPQSAMTLNEELLKLRRQVKELEKE